MNLKDAFRFQNAIQGMIGDSLTLLQDRDITLKVKSTHLRSKAREGAQDETIEDTQGKENEVKANQVVGFLAWLMEEKEKLTAAIHAAKAGLSLDMDGEIALNQQRQRIAEVLQSMTRLQNSEVLIPSGGISYCFNAEGNQVSYRYDVKKVTTIDFDRKKVRGMVVSLHQKADDISTELDKCMVNTEVAYQAPFDVNDGFDEVFGKFVTDQQQ